MEKPEKFEEIDHTTLNNNLSNAICESCKHLKDCNDDCPENFDEVVDHFMAVLRGEVK